VRPIPVLVNPSAGSAAAVRRALRGDLRFSPLDTPPAVLPAALLRAAAEGARRVAVAGGDGSVALAAGAAVRAGVELAVLPGGTLNHFARHLGIPDALPEALRVAATGRARPVAVGSVDGRVFVNTSSLGAYVDFVRARERLEPRLGHGLATLAAGAETVARLPRLDVLLETDGGTRRFATPLLFVGVGERALAPLGIQRRVEEGWPGLHVLVVHAGGAAGMLLRGLAAARGGAEEIERLPDVSSFLVDRCVVRLAAGAAELAVDGEILPARPPLEYLARRGALLAVAP
jgi:diacylglycerol kinase family enzyme